MIKLEHISKTFGDTGDGVHAVKDVSLEIGDGEIFGIIGRSGALPGARGDGIRACLWAGAKMDETHSIMMFDRTAIRPD